MALMDEIVMYMLGGLYEILLVLYIASFYGFRRGKGCYGNWKPRDTFHVIVMVLLFTRGLIFLLAPSMINGALEDFPLRLYLIWFYVDSLLYYFAYLVLILYWANEFFAIVYGTDRFFRKYRWGLIVILCILGFVSFALLVLYTVWASSSEELGIVDNVSTVYLAIINILTTVGFTAYGIRLYFIMKKYHFPVDLRRKKARRIGYIGAFCSIFFTIRAFISIWSVVENFIEGTESSKEFGVEWYFVLIFYLLFEITPLCVMLLFYRKSKTSRVQARIDYESGSESEYGTIK